MILDTPYITNEHKEAIERYPEYKDLCDEYQQQCLDLLVSIAKLQAQQLYDKNSSILQGVHG